MTNWKAYSKKVIKDICEGVGKSLRGNVIGLICAFIIAVILWPFGCKVDSQASFFRIISNFLVFSKSEKPPRIHLFSQYPYEYNIKNKEGWISDGGILEISGNSKPLWLGVYNLEPRTLHNVRFKLLPSDYVKLDEKSLNDAWLNAQFGQERKSQFDFRFPVNIAPSTGWVIPVPVSFEFPSIGNYEFTYFVISDEFGPFRGSFIVKRLK